MGRALVLMVLVVVGVSLKPELRTRVEPQVQRFLDPVYRWSVRSRVDEIARMIETDAARGLEIPTQARLAAYIRERYPRDSGPVDAWRTPFFLHRDAWSLRVASAGPDRRPGTADDILSPRVRVRSR